MSTKDIVLAAAGQGEDKLYVDDVFSTYLYTGTGSPQTITNGIDLAGEGGMVWIKSRSSASYPNHFLFDSGRWGGANSNNSLSTDTTSAQQVGFYLPFTSTGFTVGSDDSTNQSGTTYASWTFRKAPKFFDVVTYTGNGVAGRTVAHNLGSVPGMVIVKTVDGTGSWGVYHRSLPASDRLQLNATGAALTVPAYWNSTAPTASVFTVGNDGDTNQNGETFVAYLFAHDAGGFGETGDDSAVACGSYSTSGTIELGWEPQFILVKKVTNLNNFLRDWVIFDNMRGLHAPNQYANELYPNTSGAEIPNNQAIYINSTGFTLTGFDRVFNGSDTYIYLAIRRPNKPPESGAEVYESVAYTGNQTSNRQIGSSVLLDALLLTDRNATSLAWSSYGQILFSRLVGSYSLGTAQPSAETNFVGFADFDKNAGWDTGVANSTNQQYLNKTGTNYVSHIFRRAPGFFDVVCYTGTGLGGASTFAHNLNVAPELMIVKRRDAVTFWRVYASPLGATKNLILNGSDAVLTATSIWNDTDPTSTVFTVGGNGTVNAGALVAYLFATLPGISKVGSYTGTGTTQQINCGFTTGARFVLIKRTDSTGDWYVWDTARGIVSGNDPYLLLNSTAAEVTSTDYIDPLASGFEISSTAPAAINASGGSFIFLAVA